MDAVKLVLRIVVILLIIYILVMLGLYWSGTVNSFGYVKWGVALFCFEGILYQLIRILGARKNG